MQNRINLLFAVFIFFVIFFVYLITLNPVFHADDSPETISCSYTLGIQHPPGYPLPTLIGKISSLIPVGNIGFRCNLQAAFFAVLANMVLYFIIINFFKIKILDNFYINLIALITTLTFAFSYTIWSQALSAKGGIYTLNAFLLTLLIYVMFLWEKTKKDKFIYLFIYLFGVSLGNHWESMAVVTPAFLIFILMSMKEMNKKITIKNILYSLFFLLTGIFIYYYLIIRAKNNAFLNWGDPVDLKQLLWVITRAEYTSLEKARDFAVILKQIKRIFSNIAFEFTIFGFILFLLGCIYFFNKKRKYFIFLISLMLCVLLSLAFYLNLKDEMLWIMDVFLIPVYVSMALFLSAGIIFILEKVKDKKILSLLLIFVLFVLPFYNLFFNYKKADQRRYFYAYDFGLNIIKSIDKDKKSIAMLEGDFSVMPIMFFKYVAKKVDFCPVTTIFLYVPWSVKNVKNECPDINFTSKPSDLFGEKIKNIIYLNFKEREIYTSIFRDVMKDFAPDVYNFLVCNGMTMKLSAFRRDTLFNGMKNLKLLSYRNLLCDKLFWDSSTKFCLNNYSSAYLELANGLKDFNLDEIALKHFKKAVVLANENTKAESFTHLGIQYAKMGNYEEAVNCYKKAIEIKPKLIEAYSNLAGTYNTLKKYDESIKYASEAIKIKPDFSEAYNNLAIAYYYKGDKKNAIMYMEKAVGLNPKNELARQNLEIMKKELK